MLQGRYATVPDLLWTDCGDVMAVFHRGSGKTHFLNHPSHALLTKVLAAPTDLAGAARNLARLQSVDCDRNFEEHVFRLVARLEELGLVRRA